MSAKHHARAARTRRDDHLSRGVLRQSVSTLDRATCLVNREALKIHDQDHERDEQADAVSKIRGQKQGQRVVRIARHDQAGDGCTGRGDRDWLARSERPVILDRRTGTTGNNHNAVMPLDSC